MLQVIEELDEELLKSASEGSYGEDIYAIFGRRSGKLKGFKVVKNDVIRHIYFHDIDNMEKIIKGMKGIGGFNAN